MFFWGVGKRKGTRVMTRWASRLVSVEEFAHYNDAYTKIISDITIAYFAGNIMSVWHITYYLLYRWYEPRPKCTGWAKLKVAKTIWHVMFGECFGWIRDLFRLPIVAWGFSGKDHWIIQTVPTLHDKMYEFASKEQDVLSEVGSSNLIYESDMHKLQGFDGCQWLPDPQHYICFLFYLQASTDEALSTSLGQVSPRLIPA